MSGDFENKPTVRVGPTRKVGDKGSDPFSAETVKVGGSPKNTQQRPQPNPSSLDDNATRLYRPIDTEPGQVSSAGVSQGPVVAWLVVVKGPGLGSSLNLTYGLNSVGRGGDQAVRLDFGDDQISRSTHFNVAYDGINRKFYLQHGGAQNLTYLNKEPVLAPVELSSMDEISAGNSVLRFVPFCGENFDWEELKDKE
jgi:hypothetical protein